MKVVKVSPDYVKRIISEERELLLEHQRYKRMIIAEGYRLHAEGHSLEAINEGLLDIIKTLGLQFVKSFKHSIADYLLRKMTWLNPDGFLANLIKNVVEEVDILHFKKYLTPGGCDELTQLLLKALAETSVEPIVDGFMDGLGISDPTSRVYVTIRETIQEYVIAGEIGTKIMQTISGWICNLDVSAIVDVFKGEVINSPGEEGESDVMDTVKDAFSKGTSSGGRIAPDVA